MIRRRNLKVWRFFNVSHEQNFFLIWECFIQWLFYFPLVIWYNCSVKPTILKLFCNIQKVKLPIKKTCLKYKVPKSCSERVHLYRKKHTRGLQALTVTWVSETLHRLLVRRAYICISTALSYNKWKSTMV